MKSLDENLEIAFHNDCMELDIIVVNNQKCLHLSDLGLNANLIKNYEEGDLHGKWGYLLQAFKYFDKLGRPFHRNHNRQQSNRGMCGQNDSDCQFQEIWNRIVINPDGSMNDGKFELVILKNLDLIVFGKIITGNIPLNYEDVEIVSTDRASIRTNFPVSFQVDGEYCGDVNKLEISISPSKIKVAIP